MMHWLCCLFCSLFFRIVTNFEVNDELKCGNADADRIVGGTRAKLGQYPWLARLGYNRTENVTFECGGTLISKRHVLTASHCVLDIEPAVVVQVVLGEHNVTSEIDCELEKCADPVQIYRPIEIVVPTEYHKSHYKHDIALIKLDRDVNYTRWVSPICLPLPKDTNSTGIIDTFGEVAGWGLTDSHADTLAEVLQTVKLKILPLTECKKSFDQLDLGIGQMCAGGIPGKDSCSGDSGGPMQKGLAFRDKGPRYFVIGVVSLGMKMCGGDFATSALYTNVTHYIPWILKNLD
ncbi:CLIP domain-containing serine protease HP8-like [Culicoides brevitarsis]|uniref:CLIP domain-containing serine protease HP8-like n=1 Tax=Culicoides brevitarsis TaxID=469753 RepID=UPI00307BA0EB